MNDHDQESHPTKWTAEQWQAALGMPVTVLDNRGETRVVNLYFPPGEPAASAAGPAAIYVYAKGLPDTVQFDSSLWQADDQTVEQRPDGTRAANFRRLSGKPQGDEFLVTDKTLGGCDLTFSGFPEPDVTLLGLTFTLEATEGGTAIYV